MQIKVGDLVHIKTCSYLNHRHNDEIWLVIGKGKLALGLTSAWIQLQNVHNNNKVTYKESMLMKIETDKKCPLQ